MPDITGHHRTLVAATFVGAMLTVMFVSATPAAAAAPMTVGVAVTPAEYAGRTIDLARDWQGAQVCAVWGADDVRCYDSAAEMVADEADMADQDDGSMGPMALGDCPSGTFTNEWFCLFEHANHGGRMVKFKTPNTCLSLAAYSFDNQTSSWANTLGDQVLVHDNLSCGSTELLFTASPHASAATIAADNRAGSIRIVR